jgi:hypothetical protein
VPTIEPMTDVPFSTVSNTGNASIPEARAGQDG